MGGRKSLAKDFEGGLLQAGGWIGGVWYAGAGGAERAQAMGDGDMVSEAWVAAVIVALAVA